MLTKKLIFNPQGDDSKSNKRIIGGNTTNIIQLNTIKYSWADDYNKKMIDRFWIPTKFSLSQDITDYNNLTDNERDAYEKIISFLTFLDSLQTNNIPTNIIPYITASEIITCLITHTFFEEIHNQSYQYILQSIINTEQRRNEVYDLWRSSELFLNRVKSIAKFYQDFQDNPNLDTFFNVLLANYVLEGIYFYNNFSYFYTLTFRGVMHGTSDIISKINIDEEIHVKIFEFLIKDFLKEQNQTVKDKSELIYSVIDEAVKNEIEFSLYVLDNQILGINKDSITNYTKYLANKRLNNLGLKGLYDKVINPYKHLESISNATSEFNNKSNYFETTVGEYQMATTFSNDKWNF